jgi:hypothetical protein
MRKLEANIEAKESNNEGQLLRSRFLPDRGTFRLSFIMLIPSNCLSAAFQDHILYIQRNTVYKMRPQQGL